MYPNPILVKAPIRRKANFSHNETVALMNGAQKRANILLCNRANRSKIPKETKHHAWMEILDEVNAVNNAPRDLRSIKKKLQSIKYEMSKNNNMAVLLTQIGKPNGEQEQQQPCFKRQHNFSETQTQNPESGLDELDESCDTSISHIAPEVLIGATEDSNSNNLIGKISLKQKYLLRRRIFLKLLFLLAELQKQQVAVMKEQVEVLKRISQQMCERNAIEREAIGIKRRKLVLLMETMK